RRNPQSKKVLNSDSLRRLEELAADCIRMAQDENADVSVRADCIRILGLMPPQQHGGDNVETLATFLSPDHDSQLQLAAVNALSEHTKPAVADHLLSVWQSLTPTLRTRVLDVLISRNEWVAALLAAVQSHAVQPSEIDAAHQARLSEYPDA